MKKGLFLICAAGILCAGFGQKPVQQENPLPQNLPATAEEDTRIRITLPSDEEFARDLAAVREALARLADAFRIERVPAPENAAFPPA